ncbi:MAG: efflux RND transporter permease subunit, partial [Fimbriimonadaceae bacterium]|nr:efflux RND transporter permease subunit [Alphaproteobacteria bacterium]
FNGMRDEEIWVEVRPEALRRLDLTLAGISREISQNSRDMPSGTLEGSVERQVRALADAETPETIGAIEVKSLSSGEKVFLRDIAGIGGRFDENAPTGHQNGERAIEISVLRALTADTLRSAAILDNYLKNIRPTLPSTLKLNKYDVRSDRLVERINLLLRNGLGGLAIVLVVLFVFLNARIAIWVAVGIPVAMMMTVAVMWATGQTINMISLFAMILTLGIIVDDAIVVGEHTATLHERGLSALDAAEGGAGRMLLPVTAATLTTMAAFLPLFLIRDVIGQIMQALPLVVIAVLIASLAESFFILPGHLRHALKAPRKVPGFFRRNFDAGFGWFRDRPFLWVAERAYNWRYTTVALSTAMLVLSYGLTVGGQVKFQFFPSPESEVISANIVFGAGTPREEAVESLTVIENVLRDKEAELTSGAGGMITNIFSVMGQSGRNIGENVATVTVQLAASEDRDVRTREILNAWRKAIPHIPGVEQVTIAGRRGGPPGRDLDIRLIGAPSGILKQAALEVRGLIAQYPGVSGVGDDLPYGKQELILEMTPRGTALGFTIQEVGNQVRNAFEGAIAHRFAKGDEEVTVRVLQDEDNRGIEGLRALYLRSPSGRQVPLLEIVDIREQAGFALIQHIDGKNTVSVTAEVDTEVTTNTELVAALAAGPIDEIARKYNIDYKFAGRNEERARSFADLKSGLFLALGLIYLILAWVFGSYFRPLSVMIIIPFGVIGAIVGHYLLGFPLTILSFMGLLGLSGILVNDSIILVSRMEERLAEGEDMARAAVGASQDRLRAVLLTSLTTIGGLLPLIFEKSLQAQFLLPMAITLVFGLGIATLLVLFLVPAFIGIGEDIKRFSHWFLGRDRPAPAE